MLEGRIETYLPFIKLVMRIVLVCTSSLILISAILVHLFGKINGDTYNDIHSYIIWYSLMFNFWTLICSVPILLSIALYKKLTGKNVWESVKKETILLLINVIGVAIFALSVFLIPA